LILKHVACIREWGTSHGIGQLAREAPRKGTVLDPEDDQTVDRIQVIRAIPCREPAWTANKKWKAVLAKESVGQPEE
jgi:hypothetical protein